MGRDQRRGWDGQKVGDELGTELRDLFVTIVGIERMRDGHR